MKNRHLQGGQRKRENMREEKRREEIIYSLIKKLFGA
jgi:hypothetical protein